MRGGALLSQAFMRRSRSLAKLRQSRVIHLCGVPGVGKSHLGAALAARLGIPLVGIDSERVALLKPHEVWPENDAVAWGNLEDKIDAAGRCIVETSGWHGNDVVLFGGRAVFRVLVTAADDVRRERLALRQDRGDVIGWGPDYVERIMRLAPPKIGGVAATVDTSDGGPDAAGLDALVARMGAFLEGCDECKRDGGGHFWYCARA